MFTLSYLLFTTLLLILLYVQGADNWGLNVLIVTVDNRPLNSNLESTGYHTVSAVLSAEYAKRWGYEYHYYFANSTATQATLLENFPHEYDHEKFGAKYGGSLANLDLKQARGAPWSKILMLWHLQNHFAKHVDLTHETAGSFSAAKYDYVVMLDSDAAFNPRRFDRSIGDALDEWRLAAPDMIIRGLSNPRDASLVFMSNLPWRDDLPNSGVIIMRTNPLTTDLDAIIREWWNYDIPQKNEVDFFEQDALWYMLAHQDGPEYDFLLNDTVMSLVRENNIVSDWHPLYTSWIAHCPNYMSQRVDYLRYLLLWERKELNQPDTFREAVLNVQKHHVREVNLIEVAMGFQASRTTTAQQELQEILRTRKRPPVYTGKAEDRFYAIQHPETRPPPIPLATQYEGMVLAFPNDRCMYLVMDGARHCFSSLQQFLGKGYDFQIVIHIAHKNAHVFQEAIPVGDTLRG